MQGVDSRLVDRRRGKLWDQPMLVLVFGGVASVAVVYCSIGVRWCCQCGSGVLWLCMNEYLVFCVLMDLQGSSCVIRAPESHDGRKTTD